MMLCMLGFHSLSAQLLLVCTLSLSLVHASLFTPCPVHEYLSVTSVFGTAMVSTFNDHEDDMLYLLYEDNRDALDLVHRLTLHSAVD